MGPLFFKELIVLLRIEAFAKINLTLDIAARREDGYHELLMIMQSVGLSDTVTLEKGEGISADCGDFACRDEDNIACTAAALFYRAVAKPPEVKITIDKRIPTAAGLGGGSADAAAVLVGLNQMYGEPFTIDMLCEIGLKAGADIPFCITGGTALVGGIGEKLTSLRPMPDCGIVIIKPCEKPSTGEMYRRADCCESLIHPDTGAALEAIEAGDLVRICGLLGNSFDSAWRRDAADRSNIIDEAKAELESSGAIAASLSGSGPSVFGIFENLESAQAAVTRLAGRFPLIFAAGPKSTGCEISD